MGDNKQYQYLAPVMEDFHIAQTGDNKSGYLTQDVLSDGVGYLTSFVPADFELWDRVTVLLIANGNAAAHNTTITIHGGTHGELMNAKSATAVLTPTYVDDEVLEVDITAVMNAMTPALEPGDVYGISVDQTDVGGVNIDILGTRIKYRKRFPVY